MSETEEIALQWIDADVPISSAPTAKVLVLGALAPLGKEPSQPDEAFAAELKAQDFRCAALLAGALSNGDGANGEFAVNRAAQYGLDLVSLAGAACGGLSQTRDLLGGIASIGAGETEVEAFRPVVRNIGGVRAGFLAFSERPINNSYAGADILHPLAYDRVRMLQAQCDHVIVFCHAGLPKANLPLPEWRARYRRFVDAGASVVVGMPPSGVSGWEEYRNGLVFYGLGTLADDRESADDCSLAVSLSLERNGRFQYETRLIERSGGALRFSENEAEKQLINERNALFFDEQAYLTRSTEFCREIYDAWKRETGVFRTPGLGRGIFGALLSQSVQNAKREDEAKLKALLENESLRLAVRRALAAREAEKGGRNA